jgi:hypothetical protein
MEGRGTVASLGEVSFECVPLPDFCCCFPTFLKYVSSLICDLPLNPYDLILGACSCCCCCCAPKVRKEVKEDEVGGGEAACELVDPLSAFRSRVMVLPLDWDRIDGLEVDVEILLRFR